ncbi:MAG: hypothetical protein UR68_C0052G0009 [Candidatus Roizmanbacteria bacterium GW2011_GWA2_35_19]|uniref:rRNA maturation factor n=1 Tax=Candidatus Roizmanbacteria bacterium GW2011_GWA2_35_19 TaxID=1618478 RepID=A0A0G0BIZ9_9BACT|nr:MAG: hypothetical protein UR68_C0052G0009 [Candidatus Roizmanbacteria bacterium GW2011_GWA2_35_19]
MINLVCSSRYRINRSILKSKTQDLLSKADVAPEKILNLVFVGKTKMKSLALLYKKENIALPVLSFSYRNDVLDGEKLLGEVIICYPQAVLLAAERNRKVDETLLSLIKHGIENLLK